MIKTLVSAPVQTGMAKDMGNGPVNTKVDVNMPELQDGAGRRARQAGDHSPTGTPSTQHRDEWTKRWNREVER